MIDKFDSATAKEVQKAMEAVMNDVATKFGLRIHFKGGKYSTTECLYKWNFIINSPEATEEMGKEAQKEWEFWAPLHGLKSEWFGKTFQHDGYKFKITGFKNRRRKFPVSAIRLYDKLSFKFPTSTIKRRMAEGE